MIDELEITTLTFKEGHFLKKLSNGSSRLTSRNGAYSIKRSMAQSESSDPTAVLPFRIASNVALSMSTSQSQG